MSGTLCNRAAIRSVVGAFLLIVLTGCQSGTDVATEVPKTMPALVTTEAPATTAAARTAEAPQTTAVAFNDDATEAEFGDTPFGLAGDAVAERFVRPESDQNAPAPSPDVVRSRAEVDFSTAITAGRRVTITFSGPAPTTSEGLCSIDHRVEVDEETDRAVTLTLIRVTVLSPGALPGDCSNDFQTWAMTTRLQEPLGNRTLRNQWGSHVRVSREEARLVPTELPDGWVARFDDEALPIRTVDFTSSDAEQQITLTTAAEGRNVSLFNINAFGPTESVSIRRVGDGLAVVGGDPIVAFAEQGWVYELHGDAVDIELVLEVARSFERPALLDSDLSAEFIPVTTTPPQPGQEEFEARALQGVLGE